MYSYCYSMIWGGQLAVLPGKAENLKYVICSCHGSVIRGGQLEVLPGKAKNLRNVICSCHGCVILGGFIRCTQLNLKI